ncbi:hypothetical protein C8238_16415 [Paracidovorax avenae]|uniref:hypothetical protein n=1 Tax=Paracidovorax avenae TaxID=80867 RepID=UPI000D174A4B|nr:hypothetical protein [Paracidovorax avenae]AVS89621.1 hypothetical protein C8238_16415 [Paracidovorax avenae]
MSMTPEAHFDCLHIAATLDAPLGGVTRLDLQRVAFLSCLLSIYMGEPVADWGYKFANTGDGLPFSDKLIHATEFLVAADALVDRGSSLKITQRGSALLNQLGALELLSPRRPCLDAATASLLAVPGSVMAEGLQQEPTIAASRLHDSASMLLDSPHIQTLHAHFEALATVFPPGSSDLLSPSVLWLTYMAHANSQAAGDAGDDSGPGDGGPPLTQPPGGPASTALEAQPALAPQPTSVATPPLTIAAMDSPASQPSSVEVPS